MAGPGAVPGYAALAGFAPRREPPTGQDSELSPNARDRHKRHNTGATLAVAAADRGVPPPGSARICASVSRSGATACRRRRLPRSKRREGRCKRAASKSSISAVKIFRCRPSGRRLSGCEPRCSTGAALYYCSACPSKIGRSPRARRPTGELEPTSAAPARRTRRAICLARLRPRRRSQRDQPQSPQLCHCGTAEFPHRPLRRRRAAVPAPREVGRTVVDHQFDDGAQYHGGNHGGNHGGTPARSARPAVSAVRSRQAGRGAGGQGAVLRSAGV